MCTIWVDIGRLWTPKHPLGQTVCENLYKLLTILECFELAHKPYNDNTTLVQSMDIFN